jgi:hypothetical protein
LKIFWPSKRKILSNQSKIYKLSRKILKNIKPVKFSVLKNVKILLVTGQSNNTLIFQFLLVQYWKIVLIDRVYVSFVCCKYEIFVCCNCYASLKKVMCAFLTFSLKPKLGRTNIPVALYKLVVH